MNFLLKNLLLFPSIVCRGNARTTTYQPFNQRDTQENFQLKKISLENLSNSKPLYALGYKYSGLQSSVAAWKNAAQSLQPDVNVKKIVNMVYASGRVGLAAMVAAVMIAATLVVAIAVSSVILNVLLAAAPVLIGLTLVSLFLTVLTVPFNELIDMFKYLLMDIGKDLKEHAVNEALKTNKIREIIQTKIEETGRSLKEIIETDLPPRMNVTLAFAPIKISLAHLEKSLGDLIHQCNHIVKVRGGSAELNQAFLTNIVKPMQALYDEINTSLLDSELSQVDICDYKLVACVTLLTDFKESISAPNLISLL